MKADHEEFLHKNIGPATRALAEALFDRRLRDLIHDTDEETVDLVKFLCVLSFVYGVKANIEGVRLLDDDAAPGG